ncbi:MarR family transcriptional regulator [Pyruvatibacter sp.]|uniref:MarR family winged helix-turn-helix transcriptional regulator n=1 Tax=Pyruvatibacter sp. TaxID=1981328 RepID=UPI003264CFEA
MPKSPASQNRLYFLLQRTAHALKVRADTDLKNTCGLTTAQIAALNLINERAPVAQNVIARELRQKESAITAMVKRLETRGLIKKKKSAEDDRAWALEPTKKGIGALADAAPAFLEINALIDQHVPSSQAKTVGTALLKILNSLEDTPGTET